MAEFKPQCSLLLMRPTTKPAPNVRVSRPKTGISITIIFIKSCISSYSPGWNGSYEDLGCEDHCKSNNVTSTTKVLHSPQPCQRIIWRLVRVIRVFRGSSIVVVKMIHESHERHE